LPLIPRSASPRSARFLLKRSTRSRTLPLMEDLMKYGVAWLLGVPTSIIVLWFLANQMGCGL
jgi:hypothetical protein